MHPTTFGLGSGATAKATGTMLLLPWGASSVTLNNTHATSTLYVVVNALLVDGDNEVQTAEIIGEESTPSQLTDTNFATCNDAAILARGFPIAPETSHTFKGYNANHGGARIFCLALCSSSGSITVTGGQDDVSD